MSEQKKPSHRPQLIEANFNDADAAMSKRILIGFAVVAGALLLILAVPRVLERFY